MHSLLALLSACTAPGPDTRPTPRFEPGSAEPYAEPWPGDQHLDPDGTLSFTRFQRPANIALIESYIALGEQQVGWGTNAPVYFRMDGELDPDLLPTPPESLEDGSAFVLVDVDPDSPYRGERFPVVWRSSGEVTSYQPEGLLAVAPAPGFPLRPSTTYALVLTSAGFQVNEAFQEVFGADHPQHSLWAGVPEVLRRHGVHRRDIAAGAVITTSDPLGELATIARFVQSRVAPPDLDSDLELVRTYERFTAYRGRYWSPVFTHGERPYLTEGGGFVFDDAGDPVIASWDDMRVAVCVPNEQPMPPQGYPVVVYQHGTGGAYRTACNSDGLLEVGGIVGEAGFVLLGIDQPLHGPRNGGQPTSDLANFNILNPTSGRTNFRQGAIDAIYLARGLANRTTQMTLPDGTRLLLDPDAVTFVGHSQGGLTGALAAPFWAGDVKATVLSGAGGLLAITIVDRKDIIDFASLVAQVARFQPG
ncbi:MAG: hypothetical protein KC656_27875, partial [Myxococcales bacterium]|nr:hypothetical protein [Myxococcales bacterium]